VNTSRAAQWLQRIGQRFELRSHIGVPTVRTVPTRRAPRIRRDHKVSGWLVAILLAGLALTALVLAAAALHRRAPGRLDQAELSGTRLLPGRACVVLASDVSGSMQQFAATRQAAMHDLMDFSRRSLRPDDVVVVVSYDGSAGVALGPTLVRDLPHTAVAEPIPGGDGTALIPAVGKVASLLVPYHCGATGLASVTDGLLQDDPAALDHALGQAALQRVHLLIPGGQGRPGPTGDKALSEVVIDHFDPGDGAQLGLDYGHLLAELTGQSLSRR